METIRICPNCRKPLAPDLPMGLCPECLLKAGLPSGTEHGASRTGFVPPPVEEIAQLFPQLEILGFLGQGGMGAVYKARQPALDRQVALKVLPPVVAGGPGFAERFNREARALALLNHPNIVTVHDFGKAGALHYLLMEFVDGSNLREVERAGKLTPEQAVAIVPQICEALQFAHNEGVVHRDIKPENILIDKKGRVKIADFGIAKMIGIDSGPSGLTGAQDIMGTPHYMAPEQVEKPQTVDHRADIYSLGVVFYEMLTGELPLGKFAAPSQKVRVDVRLDEVVLHALEKEPSRRYQQASQVKTDVETITSGPRATAPPFAGASPVGAMPPLVVPYASPAATESDKIILPAFLLAFFFGVFGAHRFYVGKTKTAIVQLFTVGGLGIWCTIDWILLVCKVFTDGQGRRMTHWVHPSPGAGGSSTGGGAPPIAPLTPGQKPPAVPSMIIAPAVGLMVAGAYKVFTAIKGMSLFSAMFGHSAFPFYGLGIGFFAFHAVPAAVMVLGGMQMMELRSYAWSVAAAIVAIVACSFIGFPVGIWALVVLLRHDVREMFDKNPKPIFVPGQKWPWMLVAALSVLFLVSIIADSKKSSDWSWPRFPMGSLISSNDADAPDAPDPPDPPDNNATPMVVTGGNHEVTQIGGTPYFSRSLAVDAEGELTMNVDSGEIRLEGSDSNVVTVAIHRKVKHADDAESAKILKEEKVVLERNGNVVSIKARQPGTLRNRKFWDWMIGPSLDVRYDITVPRGFKAKMTTVGGSVSVARLDSDADATTAGGSLDFDTVGGKVDGHTVGGSITATSCKGAMSVETAGGSITIDRFGGPKVQATTIGGSVTANFLTAPTADSKLETTGGSVSAKLPAKAAFNLDASTMGGSVSSDWPVGTDGKRHGGSLDGEVNGGGPVLKLKTIGGSIYVSAGQ